MRKALFAALFVAVMAAGASAQDADYKRGEFGFGYSNNRVDSEGTFDPTSASNDREGFHGFYLNGGYNFHKYVGVQAEFSHHRKQTDFTLAGAAATLEGRLNQGLFGVKVQDNRTETKVRPFARALIGVGNGTGELRSPTVTANDEDTGLAAALGGGIAFRLNDNFDLTTSADYNPIRLGDAGTTETTHNFRLGVGLTIRFGSKN
jgi:opacity protein-like surface antigen